MSVVRPDKIPGIFANAGTTTIPPVPVTDTTYRDAALTEAAVENGWPYNKIVNSAEFNQILYLYSALLADVDTWGIAGWSDQVDYAQGAWVRGSDGETYRATSASGPASTAYDPVTAANRPGFWQSFDEILKSINLIWSDKVDYVHPALAFGSDDTLYVSLQNSGPSGVGAKDPLLEPTYWEIFGAGGDVTGPSSSTSNRLAQFADGTGKLLKETPYSFPTSDGTAGQVFTTDGAGNVTLENIDTTVSLKGTRATTGSWTITGLTPGKPVYLVGLPNVTGFAFCTYRVTAGTSGNGTTGSATYFYIIYSSSDTNSGTTAGGTIIPNASSITIDMINVQSTIEAYQ